MYTDKMHSEYYKRVKEWATKCKYKMSDDSIHTAAKVLIHRDGAVNYPPGHFISAILSNDLRGAISYADQDSLDHIVPIYRAYHNIDSYDIAVRYKEPEIV